MSVFLQGLVKKLNCTVFCGRSVVKCEASWKINGRSIPADGYSNVTHRYLLLCCRKNQNICSGSAGDNHQGWVQRQWQLFFHLCQVGEKYFQGRDLDCSPDHQQSVNQRFPGYVHVQRIQFLRARVKEHNPHSER